MVILIIITLDYGMHYLNINMHNWL